MRVHINAQTNVFAHRRVQINARTNVFAHMRVHQQVCSHVSECVRTDVTYFTDPDLLIWMPTVVGCYFDVVHHIFVQ